MPNGVDTTFFYPQSGAGIRNIWGFAPGDFVCGFIGNLHGWVNLEPVFLALHDLHPTFPALKLLVVGGGEKFSYFVDMAARYGISNQVVFTGPVPYSQGPAYIAAMDAGLLCRLPTQDSQNSLPVKLFEYAACGKPVIATPLNGVRQCFGNRLIYAETGLEFANAIKDLASHREKGNAIGEEGRKYVMEHFSWDAIFRQFDGLIKEVKG
jgi:glycosyltransferase involved in cell wall biosynthesis